MVSVLLAVAPRRKNPMSSEQQLTNRVRTCRIAGDGPRTNWRPGRGSRAPGSVRSRPTDWCPRPPPPWPWLPRWIAASKISFSSARRLPARRPGHGRRAVNPAGIGGPRWPDANSSIRPSRPIWESSAMTASTRKGSFASNSRPHRPTPWWLPPAIRPSGCWPMNSAVAAVFACSPSSDPARRPSPCWRRVGTRGGHPPGHGRPPRAKHGRRQGEVARRLLFVARGALAGGLGPCPRPSTPQRSCGGTVACPLGGARSRFGGPRVARRTVVRIAARRGTSPTDIEAWRRPFVAVGRTLASACVW